jgi:hypothetical protein
MREEGAVEIDSFAFVRQSLLFARLPRVIQTASAPILFPSVFAAQSPGIFFRPPSLAL